MIWQKQLLNVLYKLHFQNAHIILSGVLSPFKYTCAGIINSPQNPFAFSCYMLPFGEMAKDKAGMGCVEFHAYSPRVDCAS